MQVKYSFILNINVILMKYTAIMGSGLVRLSLIIGIDNGEILDEVGGFFQFCVT